MAAAPGKRKKPPSATGRSRAAVEPASDAGTRAASMPDLLRRAFTTGLSSLFSTNEVVRRAVGDAMPREWVDFAVDQSERTRNEFIERLAGELARTLENLELVEMAERLLEGRVIEIKAQLQLLPREGKLKARTLSFGLGDARKKR